jgi:hypothetical protein
MRSMFSVILTAKGSRFTAGTPLASRSSISKAGLPHVGAEHGELLQGRHGDNVPAPHGVETYSVLELGRVVDLDAIL